MDENDKNFEGDISRICIEELKKTIGLILGVSCVWDEMPILDLRSQK